MRDCTWLGKIALAVALLVVTACGGSASPPVRPGSAPAATTQSPASDATAAPLSASAEWDEVLAQARQEGHVVIDVPPEVGDKYRTAFQAVGERYGFTVETRTTSTGDTAPVILRECGVGRPSLDVVLGGMSEAFEVYPRGCLSSVKAMLLPEIADPANWREGVLKFQDPDGEYLLQLGEYVTGVLIYNSERLQSQDVATSRDLLKPELKRKIASHDPRQAGGGRGLATYLLDVLGPDYIRQLYLGQDVARTSDQRQLAEWIARGVYWVGLGSVERGIEPLRQEGLPIGVTRLTDLPGYVSGGTTVLKVPKDPPHPNAAKVMVNWMASRDGQKAMMEIVGQPSRRTDVEPTPNIPPYRLLEPGVHYEKEDYDFDFYTRRRPEATKTLLEILGR
ncbi:MAG TPA: extracellular solute-binding protein [Chloroflexota bacterium]|jgi:ABC-type Fe3+ transport system substrate-binding protein